MQPWTVKVMHRRKHKIKQPITGAYILSKTGNQEAKTIHWSKSHWWESSHLKSLSTLISQLLCFDCGFRCLVPCFQYFGVNRIDSYNCRPNHNHMALTNHDYLSLFFLGSASRTHNGFVKVYASWYRFMNKLHLPFSLHESHHNHIVIIAIICRPVARTNGKKRMTFTKMTTIIFFRWKRNKDRMTYFCSVKCFLTPWTD